jgi:hypothetical protein
MRTTGSNPWQRSRITEAVTSLSPDVIVALRMDRENQVVQNYYILPRIDLPGPQVCLGEHNGLALDSFCFDTLDQLYEMAARTKLGDLR